MDTDDYRTKLAEFLVADGAAGDLTYEQIVSAQTRQELGISSLNIIVVLSRYIDEHANGSVAIRPEWVSRLDDVDGIASVLREIDASALVPAEG